MSTFTRKNQNTDDYFRGGKHIPWWAAGLSIFATMLSSLTFTGIPSKAFAQDWVYAVANLMIPVTAIVAVYVAMPFFRHIDATSAYEYLEKRFSRTVRLFGSASFICFHIFRMAIVMSLTGPSPCCCNTSYSYAVRITDGCFEHCVLYAWWY